MRNTKLLIVGLMAGIILSGCGTWFHPYHEDFMCPDGDPGKCASVKSAYQESFRPASEDFSPMVKDKSRRAEVKDDQNGGAGQGDQEEYNYKRALYEELAGLIQDPTTPVLVPSKQIRVLIPGYVADSNLYYGHRYVYFEATSPQWVLPTLKERAQQ
jgi:conjugal transfer pilus assembly protein TraV